MATYAKYILSGSTLGAAIQITSTDGTLVHTAPTGTTGMDEVWLWVANLATVDRLVEVSLATATAGAVAQQITIPPYDGLYQVLPGIPINGGLSVYVTATATDGNIRAIGYVNRIAT